MGLTERQRQCFIHATNGQIEGAVLAHYERARNAKTLQGEMYWWTAVFHSNQNRGTWHAQGKKKNLAANIVREMMMREKELNNVKYYERFDDIISGVDKNTEQEVRYIEKREDLVPAVILHPDDPQMHEQQPDTLLNFILLLQDLITECNAIEMRALAYFLYKSEIDKYLDYLSEEKAKPLFDVMSELYEFTANGPIDKVAFIGGSRWHSKKAEESLQMKLKSILP